MRLLLYAYSLLAFQLILLAAQTPASSQAESQSPGVVRLKDYSFGDKEGPFLGLGISYFQALRDVKFDRERLVNNLLTIKSNGFNYVRILSMVAWDGLEIAPVTFTNRNGKVTKGWSDYDEQFRELLKLCGQNGLRVEVTLFADAQIVMPSKGARFKHMDAILAIVRGHEPYVMHLEVANEAWQNGFPGERGVADLREFAKYLRDRTKLLVAITSNDDVTERGIMSLYQGSAADLATIHLSRDTRTSEAGWFPVLDAWRVGRLPGVPPITSNEPIGPGASVATENNPIKLCAAAAFAFISNLPGYVFHSRTGVYGYTECCPPDGEEMHFANTIAIDAFKHLPKILPPDLSSWTRNDGLESAAPFTVFKGDKANEYAKNEKNNGYGCIRNIGATKGEAFVTLPIGILSKGLRLQARRKLKVDVFHPLTGVVVTNLTLEANQKFDLPQGPRAYILKGNYLE